MARETAEAPSVVRRLLTREAALFGEIGARLRALDPAVVVTCARGSSDHAAGYLKYLTEILLGLPVASIGPSVASVYAAPLRLPRAALVTISQSGRSPDLVALQARARAAGATAVAVVNTVPSPISDDADLVVPLGCGPETSVAATKSFVASTVAGAAIVAAWSGDRDLAAALDRLPDALDAALSLDWSAAADAFVAASSLYVLGRGPAFPIAEEAALKCKETAAIHAEAYSTAEVMHGPLRLVGTAFPVLALVPEDAALDTTRAALARIANAGGRVFAAGRDGLPGTRLPTVATGHGLLDPIAQVLAFYRFIEEVSRARGFDPDRPANLAKVTETR